MKQKRDTVKFFKKTLVWAVALSTAGIYAMDLEMTVLNQDIPNASIHDIDNQLKILALDSNLEKSVEEMSHTHTLYATDQEGRTRLHYAAFLSCHNALPTISAILKEEPELANLPDAYGETPLHVALTIIPQTEYESSCVFDVCSELISHGADPKILTARGESAYDYARKITGVPMLSALCEDSKLAQIDKKLLITGPHCPSLRTLIKERSITACDVNGRTRLHYAASFKDTNITQLILEHPEGKTLVNMQDNKKETALHLWLSHAPCESFESKAMHSACTQLLAYGADPLIGNSMGENALHYVLKNHTLEDTFLKNQVFLLAQLCEHAKSINAQNIYGETALHVLLRSVPFSGYLIGLLQILLQHGANPALGDNLHETPLHYLAHRPDFRDNVFKEQVEAAELLITYGATLDARDGYGETPLHTACKSHGQESQEAATNRLHFVPLLLKCGADANAESNIGFSPLHLLVATNYTEDKARAANCMLRYHSANPNQITKAGFTCLHVAVAASQLAWVNFLLEQPGIDIYAKHQPRLKRAQLVGGNTALDMATQMVLLPREIPPSTVKIVKEKEAPAGSPGMRRAMDNYEVIKQDTKWLKANKQHAINKIFVALLAKLIDRTL